MKAVGVCGTDIHILDGTLAAARRPPLVLGHEIAGEVDAVGEGVTQVHPGERVTVDQVIGCGDCFFCRRQSLKYCERGDELGITRNGGCQDFVIVPEANLHRLPDQISYEEGAILDMEVWAALRKCGVRAGDLAVVIGDDPAGMVACQVLRIMGARRVILSGKSRSRLAKAETLGLADVCLPDVELAELLRAEGNGHGADLVADCAGTESSAAQAIAVVAPGGRVLFYGVHPGVLSHFDLNQIVLKNLAVFGALSDRMGWEDMIDLVSQRKLRLDILITHRFPLESAPQAYQLVRMKTDGVIKAVLTLQ